ncbi:MAG: hypothetical protein WCP33_01230 [Deltaproteobacteria bacterium]
MSLIQAAQLIFHQGVFPRTVKELARIETAIGIEPSYEEPAPSTHKTP